MKRGDQCHPRNQQGFSLPEALIAALFFSVSLLGVLQYHQALLKGFSSLWQQRQAWSVLHQHIDSAGEDIYIRNETELVISSVYWPN